MNGTAVDLQHIHWPQFFSAAVYRWREAAYPLAFENARRIASISSFVTKDVSHHYRIPTSKIETIWLAPITQFYEKTDAGYRELTCRSLKLPEKFLLFPAMPYEHKNHIRLLEALALIRERDQTIVSLVAPGSLQLHWDQVKKRIKELKLENQVVFPGFIASRDLRALYQTASALVFPSLFEGFPNSLIEAMYCGVPCVVSRYHEGLTDIMTPGIDGLVVDPKDITQMVQALKKILTSSDLSSILTQNAKKKVNSYNKNSIIRRFENFFLTLL